MKPSSPSPPAHTEIPITRCAVCGRNHVNRQTLTAGLVAYVSSYALSSIYTFHSRGGILPRPIGRRNGSPRWSACDVAAWIENELPAEKLEPVKGRRSGGAA